MKKFMASILLVSSLNAQATSLFDPGLFQVLGIVGGAYAGNQLGNGSAGATIGGAVVGSIIADTVQDYRQRDCPKVDPYAVPPNPYTMPQYRCGRYQ